MGDDDVTLEHNRAHLFPTIKYLTTWSMIGPRMSDFIGATAATWTYIKVKPNSPYNS